jgi:hypothetical protein
MHARAPWTRLQTSSRAKHAQVNGGLPEPDQAAHAADLAREAALLRGCDHPNIVHALGLRRPPGARHPQLVLERLAGGSLDRRIRCARRQPRGHC